MKKTILLLAVVSMAFCIKAKAQTEAEMKAWQTYMTPGEAHKMLAADVGEWNQEVTSFMNGQSAKFNTTATTEMIMGGRYRVSKTKGDMMGMPFEGMSLIGYDNVKKIFTMTWVDNMGTGTATFEGPWDEATKSITFKGKMIDPMTGKELMSRQVYKMIDKDTQLIEMYDAKDGKEQKTMEIKCTRKV